MIEPRIHRLDLEQALQKFPGESAVIRRLFLADPMFRGVCEDYRLAAEALAGFQGRPDATNRPEIEEYRRVMAELEAEIIALVHATRGGG